MLVGSDGKWDYVLGTIKVDGLEPSSELKELIDKEKRGEMIMEDTRRVLDKKYKVEEQGKYDERPLFISTYGTTKKFCQYSGRKRAFPYGDGIYQFTTYRARYERICKLF